MKRFSYFFMAGLMTLGLWSCSDDADINAGGENEISADKVYMSFKLELPTAGRSATDNPDDPEGGDTNSNAKPDYEVGTTGENTITTMRVVLATKETSGYTYVTESSDATLTGANDAYVATFKSEALAGKASSDVYVFVFCNYPAGTVFSDSKILKGESSVAVANVSEIAATNNFYMANASPTKKTLPDANELAAFNTPANACPLGEVKVERAAARFDFAQKASAGALPANAYTLEKTSDLDETPVVYVELTDMALINVSNNFHYLRHVADATADPVGYDDGNITICGVETATNFVVDSDAEVKKTYDDLPQNFYNYWNTTSTNGAITAGTVMNFGTIWTNLIPSEKTQISSLSESDNWDPTTGTDPGYKVWRYATENTLPTVAKQIKSLSTAVLFKGYLTDRKEGANNRLNGTSNVYVHNNVLYGSWTQVVSAAENPGSDPRLISLKYAVDAMKNMIAGYDENNDTDPSNNITEPKKVDAAAAGFTVYSPDGGQYPVYYYYINKHNANTSNTEMGPMEFAVVRNNVYKLAVTGISKFGHPSDPTGDPDPVDPTEPDEEKEVYFTVSVKVLPWVVRVKKHS